MQKKIGPFEAYVPQRDTEDLILQILASLKIQESEFEMKPIQLFRFFFKQKEKYPDLFLDISFNHDPYFPYSAEIEEAFTQLQGNDYLCRPNPSLDRYRITIDLRTRKNDAEESDNIIISEIAEEFSEEFNVREYK